MRQFCLLVFPGFGLCADGALLDRALVERELRVQRLVDEIWRLESIGALLAYFV